MIGILLNGERSDAGTIISLPQRAFAPKLNAADAKLVKYLAKHRRSAGLLRGYYCPGWELVKGRLNAVSRIKILIIFVSDGKE